VIIVCLADARSTVTRVGDFVQRKSHAAAAGGAGASGLAGIKSGLAAVRNFGLAEIRIVPTSRHLQCSK
jgi:hypothetical protein